MAACDSASQDKGLDVPEAAWRLPQSPRTRRVCLRELLRVIPPDEVCAEVQAWLGECGSAAHGLRLALSDSDIRALRNSPSAPPLRQREVILGHLRERNKSAANIGFGYVNFRCDVTFRVWFSPTGCRCAPRAAERTLEKIY